MNKLIRGLATAALALAIGAAPVFAGTPGAKPGTSTIVEIVLAADGEFDALQSAVVEAGLVDALNGGDQHTVFAPTDAAFVATFRAVLGNNALTEADVIGFIEAGGVDAGLGEGALANILLYHVTNGRRTSASVIAAPQYRMLNGVALSRADLVTAGIVATDISASNGVIHVIGSVLLP